MARAGAFAAFVLAGGRDGILARVRMVRASAAWLIVPVTFVGGCAALAGIDEPSVLADAGHADGADGADGSGSSSGSGSGSSSGSSSSGGGSGSSSGVGQCTQGETRCAGTGVQTCGPNGEWGTFMACLAGMCTGDACPACSPGQTACDIEDEYLYTCGADGGWGSRYECPDDCLNGKCM
jgi:hypothetical protein